MCQTKERGILANMNEQENSSTSPVPPPVAPKEPSSVRPGLSSFFREIVIFALIAFGIVLPFRLLIAEPYVVSGASMDPTFHTGDYLIVDKISYRLHDPKRNSVVVFKFPTNTSRNLIKRIIGMPGDTVTIKNNTVTITNPENPTGFTLDQSYLVHKSTEPLTIALKADEFFVMGDNRPESYDSRSWGILPRRDIVGRPVLRILPLSQIGILPGDDTR